MNVWDSWIFSVEHLFTKTVFLFSLESTGKPVVPIRLQNYKPQHLTLFTIMLPNLVQRIFRQLCSTMIAVRNALKTKKNALTFIQNKDLYTLIILLHSELYF